MAKFPRFVEEVRLAEQDRKNSERVYNLVPQEWQAKVIDYVNMPVHDREVLWVIDEVGGKGKTYLGEYLIASRGAAYFTGGNKNDIAYAWKGEGIVIFDYARGGAEYVNYATIESIKNGMIFSGKYASGLKRYAKPHVIIFSNFEPDMAKLSLDRWNIMTL